MSLAFSVRSRQSLLMTNIILHDYWRSTASYRVRLVLNLKNIDFELRSVNLLIGEHKQDPYMDQNPMGLVPTLSIGDLHLTQSLAIIDYLDAIYPDPAMVSDDPVERSRTLAQALNIAADIHPINNMAIGNYLKEHFGADQQGVVTWMHHWMKRGFDALEEQAPESGIFGGDVPNLADVCLVPQLYNARRFAMNLGDYPKLARIDMDCANLEAFQKSTPELAKEQG